MKDFFKYEDPLKNKAIFHNLNFFEWILPLLVLFSLVFLIIRFKSHIQQTVYLDFSIRLTLGILLIFFFAAHHLLEWMNDKGINRYNLPLQLCSFSMVLASIVAFTKNRKLHAFLMYAGIMGGLSSLVVPMVGYSYQYFRYYQFMIGHILIIVLPVYFLVIYNYVPTLKTTIKVFLTLQVMAIFITIFNTILNTDYFFLSLRSEYAIDNTIVELLGGYPWYLISVEILGIIIIYLEYGLIHFFYDKKEKQNIIIKQTPFVLMEKSNN